MKVTIHTDTATLPQLPEGSYFHSRELMELCLRTPRHKPYMVVVTDDVKVCMSGKKKIWCSR